MKLEAIDPDDVLRGVGAVTARKDNRRAERIKALAMLVGNAHSPEELEEWRDMLGISDDFLAPDPVVEHKERGRAVMRHSRSGPVSL